MSTRYWIAVPSDGVYQVCYENGSTSCVAVSGDGRHQVLYDNGQDPYLVRLGGLTSGGRMLNLSGGVVLKALTSPAHLEAITCLHGADSVVSLATGQSRLDVVRQLAAEIAAAVDFSGKITVERVLGGSESTLVLGSHPSTLSASVYAVLADWTDESLSALGPMTLDELIYKEV